MQNVLMALQRSEDGLSRVELTTVTGISKATMSSITEQLLRVGLIREAGSRKSALGRRPVMLELVPSWAHVGAVHMASTKIRVAIVDLKYRIAGETSIASEEAPLDARTLGRLKEAITGLCRELHVDWTTNILGVGVLLPGIVDIRTGDVVSRLHDFARFPLKTHLQQTWGTWVQVENNANGFALAEQLQRDASQADNMVAVLMDEGVGAGIIANGTLVRGAGMGAGHVGHMPVRYAESSSQERRPGTIEDLLNRAALLEAFRRQCQRHPLSEGGQAQRSQENPAEWAMAELIRLARQGAPQALAVLEETGRILGLALADLINVLDPALIVVGGELWEQAGSLLMRPLLDSVDANTWELLRGTVTIQDSALGASALLIGAASLILESALRAPLQGVLDPYARNLADLVAQEIHNTGTTPIP